MNLIHILWGIVVFGMLFIIFTTIGIIPLIMHCVTSLIEMTSRKKKPKRRRQQSRYKKRINRERRESIDDDYAELRGEEQSAIMDEEDEDYP